MRIFNTQAELMSMISTLNLQEEGASYVKSYPKYVIGYRRQGVQIIKGKKTYTGLRDIGAYLKPYPMSNLPINIHGWAIEDFPAEIGMHLPVDLSGYLKVFYRNTKDITASIYAWQYKDLSAFLNTMRKQDLQAMISPILPVDLPAYLKVWPEEDLPGYLRGWQYYDLSASLNVIFSNNLPIYIGAHPWVDFKARIKGWVREAYRDIGISIRGFAYEDIIAIIRATYLNNIGAIIYPIQPVDIRSVIHGWAIRDLGAILNGLDYPFNLTANITGTGGYTDLLVRISSVASIHNYINLPTTLQGFAASNLISAIECIAAPNLTAYINAVGGTYNLAASIYPKIVRLSTLLPIATLEHKNLYAIINASCRWSMGVDLSAFLRPVYLRDISAYVKGVSDSEVRRDLGATVGFHAQNVVVDKLSINISLPNYLYKEIDKFTLYIKIFNGLGYLPASITGIHITKDLGSSITGIYLRDYSFKYSKNWERVYDLEYNGWENGKEDVEISFKSVVEDYFFVDAESKVYKIDDLDRWVVNVRSFTNVVNRIKVKRRLHRARLLYDLQKFNDVDEAVRYLIDHVTDIPYSDLSSYIYTSSKSVNLGCSIVPMYIKHANNILSSTIVGTQPTVVYTTNTTLEVL